MSKEMSGVHKKLKHLFSLTGIRTDVLPGIKIAFFAVYAVFVQFREELLAGLGIGDIKPVAAYIVLGIGASVASVILWAVSGYILDPIYDFFYGPGGLWTKKPGRQWGLFYSGYDLELFRKKARKKLAKEDKSYNDLGVSIHGPTLDRLKNSGKGRLIQEVEAELENSKAFRNAILPMVFLLAWFAYTGSVGSSLVSMVALVALVELSFRGRAQHALKAYRWIVGN